MPLEPGTRLGPYQVGALVGSGGMGEVYKARDTRLARTVALKVLHADLHADAASRARFEREARAAATLNHPHICAVHDVGEATLDGQPNLHYLVLELVEARRSPTASPEDRSQSPRRWRLPAWCCWR